MSKPTHLLIPTQEWERLRESHGFLDEDSRNDALVTYVTQQGKQISLDDEGIEDKAKKARKDIFGEIPPFDHESNYGANMLSKGYKQALKDLL